MTRKRSLKIAIKKCHEDEEMEPELPCIPSNLLSKNTSFKKYVRPTWINPEEDKRLFNLTEEQLTFHKFFFNEPMNKKPDILKVHGYGKFCLCKLLPPYNSQ